MAVRFDCQPFLFDFLQAAVATPILGMDFLAKFELTIIPLKRQVLHTAMGRIFSQASTIFLITHGTPTPLPPTYLHRFKNYSRNSHSYSNRARHCRIHCTE